MKKFLLGIFTLMFIVTISACGGGGDGDSGGDSGDSLEIANLIGVWEMTETITTDDCDVTADGLISISSDDKLTFISGQGVNAKIIQDSSGTILEITSCDVYNYEDVMRLPFVVNFSDEPNMFSELSSCDVDIQSSDKIIITCTNDIVDQLPFTYKLELTEVGDILASYQGSYSGAWDTTIEGLGIGTWIATINPFGGIDSTVNGEYNFNDGSSKPFAESLKGFVDSSGSMNMRDRTDYGSGIRVFTGTINALTGDVTGIWSNNKYEMEGIYNGNKLLID